MKINPLDDRVVVRTNEAEETTAGGIVLPDAAQEKPQRGTVLAVGPGRLLDSGERATVSVEVGDEIWVPEKDRIDYWAFTQSTLRTLAEALTLIVVVQSFQ